MLTKPWPPADRAGSKPGAVVAHGERNSSSMWPMVIVRWASAPACLPAFWIASRQQK